MVSGIIGYETDDLLPHIEEDLHSGTFTLYHLEVVQLFTGRCTLWIDKRDTAIALFRALRKSELVLSMRLSFGTCELAMYRKGRRA
jgi:hypothetical protein